MDKEKLITIAIGLAVGIIAAAGYFAITKYLPAIRGLSDKVTFTPAPTPITKSPTATLILNLDDFSSTTEATLPLAGTTTPNARLVIFANADEKVASADATGSFATSLKLEDGENEISVTSFDALGHPTITKRNITLEISQ